MISASAAVVPVNVTLNPAAVLAGSSAQGTVTLNNAAPTGGLTVVLVSTSMATVPKNVTVPEGQKAAAFMVATSAGSSGTSTISATANSATASAVLSLQAPIPQTAWKLKYVDSQETVAANNAATNAFDGNPNTFWHTQYSGPNAHPPLPHEIQISLGAT